jgi:hypothetical protein
VGNNGFSLLKSLTSKIGAFPMLTLHAHVDLMKKQLLFTNTFQYHLHYTKSFGAFAADMFQIEVFCAVTQYSIVVGYQHFGGPCCLHLHWVVTSCNDVVGYQRFGGPCCTHLHWVVTSCGVVVSNATRHHNPEDLDLIHLHVVQHKIIMIIFT